MAPACFVCTGKDCRKSKGHAALLRTLEGSGAEIELVPCQDICHGPVAGVALGGEVHWFERLRKEKRRRALQALLAQPDGPRPAELAGRAVPKRTGRLRRFSRARAA